MDIGQGNAPDLASICVAHNAAGKKLAEDFVALAGAMYYLRGQANAKWGARAGDAVEPQLPTLDDLADATETIDGDSAQVIGTSVWPIHLIRIHGRWRIDVDWLSQSDDMPANPRWFGEMARAVRRTGEDIASGRLGTVEAASEAMAAREQAIPDTAATQPTTEP